MSAPDRPRKRRWRRVLLIFFLFVAGGAVVRVWTAKPVIREGSVLLLELKGDYPEQPPESWRPSFLGDRDMSFWELLDTIRDAARDERIKGMVVRLRELEVSWARAQEIRRVLAQLREAGKPVVAYLEHELAGSTLEYYVASVAERVYLPPAASAPLTGLMAQYVFLGGVWEKLDVEMDVEQVGEYKSMGDMIKRKSMSEPHREMANSLLDSIYEQVVSGVAEARKLEPDAVRRAIDLGPTTADDFVKSGLADGAKVLEDLRRELAGARRPFLRAARYRKAGGWQPAEEPAHGIAVVCASGPINLGESRGGIAGLETVGSDALAGALRRAARDERIDAIVLRVNSPGGSALASDLLFQAVRNARERKPVIVSMSDVAASGGYYLAAGANRVLADPGTFTGSIGVVLSKPNLRGLLAKLGANTETLRRGERAGLSSTMTSLTTKERERLVAAMQNVYTLFVARVAEGRNLPPERVDELGRGRVWTGLQAQAHGLVDELGGLWEAIAAAKNAANIPAAEEVKVTFFPREKGLVARLSRYLGARVESATPRWWRSVTAAVAAHDFSDGALLTMMPQLVEIR